MVRRKNSPYKCPYCKITFSSRFFKVGQCCVVGALTHRLDTLRFMWALTPNQQRVRLIMLKQDVSLLAQSIDNEIDRLCKILDK